MRKLKCSVFFLMAIILFSTGDVVSATGSPTGIQHSIPAFGPTDEVNGIQLPLPAYWKEIDIYGSLDEKTALEAVARGNYDFYWNEVPLRRLENILQEYNQVNVTKAINVWWALDLNFVGDPETGLVNASGKIVFNPLALRGVRYAMNWLINRQYIVSQILQGSGAPMFGPEVSGQVDAYMRIKTVAKALGFTEQGDENYALKLIDEAMNNAAKELAKKGHKLEKKDGKWYFDGEPVKVKVVARVEDQRLDEGKYVAQILQKAGFKVDLLQWQRSQASKVVYLQAPDTIVNGTLQWHVYTEGWVSPRIQSVTSIAWDFWFFDYYVDPNWATNYQNPVTLQDLVNTVAGGDLNKFISELNLKYYNTPDKLKPLLKWRGYDFAMVLAYNSWKGPDNQSISIEALDQFWDLYKFAYGTHMLNSPRVYTVETWNFFLTNKRITVTMPDPISGLGSFLAARSIKPADDSENKTLKIAQPAFQESLFMGVFNPSPSGITDVYTHRPWYFLNDRAVVMGPDAQYHNYRCQLVSIKYNVPVPDDAVIWNGTQKKWVAPYAGKTAKSAVTWKCGLGTWVDGQPITLADYLFDYAMVWEWAYQDGKGDKFYSEDYANNYQGRLQLIMGLKVDKVTKNYIEYTLYQDYVVPYDKWSTAIGNFMEKPAFPWELYNVMSQMVANGVNGKEFSWSTTPQNGYQLDMIDPEQAPYFKAEAQALMKDPIPVWLSTLKPWLQKWGVSEEEAGITVDLAKAGYEGIIKWVDNYKNVLISDGPYYVEKYDPSNLKLVLKRATETGQNRGGTYLLFNEPIRAHPEGLTVIDVKLNTTQALGALQFNIIFDPSLLRVLNVTWGNALPGDALSEYYVNNSKGVITVGIITTNGISKNGTIVRIIARVNAKVGQNPHVSIVPVDASDISGTMEIAIPPVSASILVLPKGDVNNDGRVTAVDALLYLRAAVGLSTAPYNVTPLIDDLNCDGKITAVDALKVLRVAVGLEELG